MTTAFTCYPAGLFARSRALALVVVASMAVASPVAAQGFFGSSSKNEGELAVRMSHIEEQMRTLTGQIEELNHQLRQTQDQLRRAQEDNEFRFQELEGGKTGKRSDASSTRSDTGRAQAAGNTSPATGRPANTPAPRGDDKYARERAASVQDLGSFNVPAGTGANGPPVGGLNPSGAPLDLSALARGNGAGTYRADNPDTSVPGVATNDDQIGRLVNGPAGGSSRGAYDEAYNLILRGDYDKAATKFRQFLNDYPDDPLAANAQYWLGESFYGRGKYRDAADAFLKTYTDYPSNDKAPDSLLKLGLSLNGLGQTDAACATYSELLTKYPGASRGVLDQARQEQKSAGCRS